MKKLLFFLLVALVCSSWKTSQDEDTWDGFLPPDLKNTTILVEKFEYRNPTKYKPALLTEGSFEWPKQLPEGIYESDSVQQFTESGKPVWEHPLVKTTNKNLDKYNDKLPKLFKRYKYKNAIASTKEIQDDPKYQDLREYRYVLKRVPFLRVNEGPVGGFYYTYVFYIYDRVEDKNLKTIDIFNSSHILALKKLIKRLNEI